LRLAREVDDKLFVEGHRQKGWRSHPVSFTLLSFRVRVDRFVRIL
jgi:hypothetical protein